MSRDWAATLWPASFNGVPFWIERDTDAQEKRLVIHEFPGRDDPFIEDLGAKYRTFEISGYLVGDTADGDTDALLAAALPPGAGTLVLPAQGPINARFWKSKRDRARDRAGFFGVQLTFVQEGASVPNAPTDFLAQMVFDAGDALAAAATTLLSSVSLS